MTDRITFFQSYYDAMSGLPADEFKEIMDAVFQYVFYDRIPENLSPVANGYFILMKPNLDSSLSKSRNGGQGGTRKRTESRSEAELEQTVSETEANTKQTVSKPEANGKQTGSKSEANVKQVEVEVEEEVEVEKEVEAEKHSAQVRPIRHKHGKYGHVMLTDDQLANLISKHGKEQTEAAIQEVDDYCESNGRSYKNYALVLEKWGYRAAAEHARSGTTRSPLKSRGNFSNYEHETTDYNALAKQLMGAGP